MVQHAGLNSQNRTEGDPPVSTPNFFQQDDQIEVVELHGDDWVIYDRRQEQRTGCGVVGFVTHVAGLYELLELSAPAEPQYFDSLRAAVDVFCEVPAAA
jgi:hypothetical protein